MMKNNFTKTLLAILLIMSVISLTGCSGLKAVFSSKDLNNSDSESSQGYSIYYISTDETQIKAFSYKLTSTTGNDIIDECIKALADTPDDSKYKAVIGEDVKLEKIDYPGDDKTLNLYFNQAYNNLSRTSEILVRAAIVKTLTQFGGIVNYVSFCIGDQWLTDEDDSVLKMSGEDFVSTLNTVTSQVTEAEFTLFFASSDGLKLKKTLVSMKYDSVTAHPEQIVINALIRGPSCADCKSVISRDTQIKSTYIKDGVCNVDFNKAFLEKVEDQNFALNVYSLVDSLTQLDGIDKVHITIDGEEIETGTDNVPMSGDLTPDMSMVAE